MGKKQITLASTCITLALTTGCNQTPVGPYLGNPNPPTPQAALNCVGQIHSNKGQAQSAGFVIADGNSGYICTAADNVTQVDGSILPTVKMSNNLGTAEGTEKVTTGETKQLGNEVGRDFVGYKIGKASGAIQTLTLAFSTIKIGEPLWVLTSTGNMIRAWVTKADNGTCELKFKEAVAASVEEGDPILNPNGNVAAMLISTQQQENSGTASAIRAKLIHAMLHE